MILCGDEEDGRRLAHGYAVVDRRPTQPTILAVKPTRSAAREWKQRHDLELPGVKVQRVKLTVYGS